MAVDGRAEILVGCGAAGEVLPDGALGPDGIVIRLRGEDLVLSGQGPRGTLYAVYEFLEAAVGCRWWTATAHDTPHRPDLVVDDLDLVFTPTLGYRESFWFDAFDGDWAVRNKCNGNGHRLDAARGGKISYAGFVHTAYQLIPPDRYFAPHPEWFSLRDGARVAAGAQLCLTNTAMRVELVANLRTLLGAHPEARITSVSQNDNTNSCQCEPCRTLDEQEGSPAGTMLRFVNAVAAAIEDEFPAVTVSTLAYQYTRHPPLLVRPRANVMVRLCSIECTFGEPLTAPVNRAFRDDLVGWSRLTDRLFIWDYVTNFRHYLLPHPNLRVLGPNLRFFADHHVDGVMEQGAYTSPGTEMAPLRAWVLAKILWDPSQDAAALVDTFLNGYYGAAAPHIAAYLDDLHGASSAAHDWVGFYDRADRAEGFTLEVLTAAVDHFRAAREVVAGQPDLLRRVRIAELPVLYAGLVRWEKLHTEVGVGGLAWPLDEDIDVLHRRFLALASMAGVSGLGESAGLDRLQAKVAAISGIPTVRGTFPRSINE